MANKDGNRHGNFRHGHTINNKKTRIYKIWKGMISRCYHKGNSGYHKYGAKGILVCDRWHLFENFLTDMGEIPDGKSLDRFPMKDGPYSPENCRWATRSEQADNRKLTKFITFKNETKSISAWAKNVGIKYRCLYARLNIHGWSIERALTTPKMDVNEIVLNASHKRWNINDQI